MNVISTFEHSAKSKCRLVFPEAEDERIIAAVRAAKDRKLATPVLVGNAMRIRVVANEAGIHIDDIEIKDMSKPLDRKYVLAYARIRNVSETVALKLLQNSLFLSALLVRLGEADGMLAGAVFTSADMIMAAEGIIGLAKRVSVPSSFFIMEIPGYEGPAGNLLIFADSSVNVNPTAEQLADIAVTTAKTTKSLLGWKPRVAMLSFSTKGSATHACAYKIIKATKLARRKAPGITIDGELQGDTALVRDTAVRKMHGKIGNVAGRSNVLIFPNLDAGNISYKLVQTLAKANAYGPILQGFAKPVSDLSRGAKVSDIIGAIAILSTWARVKR